LSFGCLPKNPTKEGIRASVFYDRKANARSEKAGSPKTPPPTMKIVATNLAKEYVRQGLFAKYCSDIPVATDPDVLAKSLESEADSDESNELKCVKRLYYIAKNWSARQPTLYDELMRIHSRIEFERSFSLVTIALIPWAGVFLLNIAALRYASLVRGAPPSGSEAKPRGVWRFHPDGLMRRKFRIPIAIGLFVLSGASMWWITNWLLEGESETLFSTWTFAFLASTIVAFVLFAVIRFKSINRPDWLRSCSMVALLVLVLLTGHLLGFYAYVTDE
jgi:hypothetical protein